MRDNVRIETLFSLFTSSDRAEAIAGDLIEQRPERGSPWFWWHVLATAAALWRTAATRSPLRTLVLAMTGCVFLAVPAFAGVAAVSLFPALLSGFVAWSLLSFFWWGGALWAGASIVALSPPRGMAACVTLAALAEALLLAMSLAGVRLDAGSDTSAIFYLTAAGAAVRPQQAEWKDASTHSATFITVDDGVQLEVLDWGGSGSPLVLLAGLGDTAHVFDDFAPMLTARHRVWGVTRRAHGRSSAPTSGYSFTRLADDVVRVIETSGITRPVIVGHSIAGEELHVLGSRYATKIAGLVYVDAAFNRADGSDDYDAAARALPPTPRPQPGDMVSFAALRAFLERIQGSAGPEAHLRARYLANADGSVRGSWAPELAIRQAMSAEMQAAFKTYNPERIRVSALAIYAVPKSAADLMRPWYAADESAIRERVQTLFRLARESFGRHAHWFSTFAEQGRVQELSGAHHLFISNPPEVLQQIEAFVTSLSEKR